MKTLLASLLLFSPMGVMAQGRPGDLGVGFILGTPFGFSAKYRIDSRLALDGAVGVFNGDLDAHFDILTHLSDFLPQPKQGKLPFYLGFGVKIKDESDTFFGFRFVAGASYLFPKHPLELFAEIAPVLRVAPSADSSLDGGVGLRYYFSTGRK